MAILKFVLIVITVIILIYNGIIDNESDENRFIVNCLFLLYLIYLLFT